MTACPVKIIGYPAFDDFLYLYNENRYAKIIGEKIQELLFGLNEEKGITLIIVTHDEDLAAKCKRQVRVSDGLIISDSKNAELVDFTDDEDDEIDDWEAKEIRQGHTLAEDLDADGIREYNSIRRIDVDEEEGDN